MKTIILLLLAPALALGQSVKLAWDGTAPTYRVYRSETQNVPRTAPLASPNTNAYTDATVHSGKTYYYVVTAVGAAPALLESGPSNVVTVTVASAPPQLPSTLKAQFMGVSGDRTSPSQGSADGLADWMFAVTGLRGTPNRIQITMSGGRLWEHPINNGWWITFPEFLGDGKANFWASIAESYETAHVTVFYPDGSSDETDSFVAAPAPPPAPTDPCVLSPMRAPTGLKWPTSRTGGRSVTWNSSSTQIVGIDYRWPLGGRQSAKFYDPRGCSVTVSK